MFSLHRSCLLLRSYELTNRRKNLITLATLIASVALIEIVNLAPTLSQIQSGALHGASADSLLMVALESTASFFTFAFLAMLSFFTVDTFSMLQSKSDRTNFFMLPASIPEKFVTRIVYVAVLNTLMFVVATVAGSALRMLILGIAGLDTLGLMPWLNSIGVVTSIESEPYFGTALLTATFFVWGPVCSAATFLLGSACFRKHAFWKTILAIFSFSLLLTLLGASTRLFGDGIMLIDRLDPSANMLLGWAIGVGIFIAAALVAAAYAVFKRITVTSQKWF